LNRAASGLAKPKSNERGTKQMDAASPNRGQLHVVPETDEIAALCLEGEFDLANSSRILEEGERLLANNHVILDVGQATFVDSSVIQALARLGAEAMRNGRVAFLQLGTAATVERVIEISGIDRVLPRTKTRAEAIDTIHQLRRPQG
jgi:anti-anti-sigma factor